MVNVGKYTFRPMDGMGMVDLVVEIPLNTPVDIDFFLFLQNWQSLPKSSRSNSWSLKRPLAPKGKDPLPLPPFFKG